jgi:hypothetical protein
MMIQIFKANNFCPCFSVNIFVPFTLFNDTFQHVFNIIAVRLPFNFCFKCFDKFVFEYISTNYLKIHI